MAYGEKHGPLWHGGRLEQGFALVAHTVARGIPQPKGAQAPKFQDFLPQRGSASQEVLTLEEAIVLMR